MEYRKTASSRGSIFARSPDLFLPEVRVFAEVARLRSMSNAAEKLSLNQPTVSKAIQKLEKRMGKRLFIRNLRGAALTYDGELLFRQVEAARQLISDTEQNRPGLRTLKVGMHQSLAIQLMPRFLPRIKAEFPNLSLQFVFAPSLQISRMIPTHEIDIGVVINPLKLKQAVFRRLDREHVSRWVASPEAKDKQRYLLLHPDMIYAAKIERQSDLEIIQIADYEVIAQVVRKNPECAGVLPLDIARRHGLTVDGAPLFWVNLAVVAHEDRFDRELFRSIVDAF